jgi:hypothetical protein
MRPRITGPWGEALVGYPLVRNSITGLGLEQVQQATYGTAVLSRMAHQAFPIDEVLVSPADAAPLEKSGVDKLGDDSLDRSFGDPDLLRDVSEADSRVSRDANQNLGVVGDEGPAR